MTIIPEPKTCKKGLHRYSSALKRCPECQRINSKKWYEKNKDKHKEKMKKWYQRNKDVHNNRNLKWYKANKKRAQNNSKRWRNENPQLVRKYVYDYVLRNKELVKKRKKQWEKENKHKVYAKNAKRRAAKKNAVPSWANLNAIKHIYRECERLTKETGIQHHVDHIYPLQSPYMCGLHVEANLQILTSEENHKKYNNSWPGQLDCQRNKKFTP